jgi:glycosyltransferase involved in cell wall biosynthesis
MRIAYIAPYQGPTLKKRRPIKSNLSLAGSVKIEVIAKILRAAGHEIEIFSQGEVVELAPKFYPAFAEPDRFHPDVPVNYSSAFPVRYINGMWQGAGLRSLFVARHRSAPFDCVLIYNLKVPQIMCAEHAAEKLRLPVVFEYEDDAFLDIDGRPAAGLRPGYIRRAKSILASVSGGFACSPHLLAQLPANRPRMMVRGAVGDEILRASGKPDSAKKDWVLFSGTLSHTKGVAPLIQAWSQAQLRGWELHIAGDGPEAAALKKMANDRANIVFYGTVRGRELAELTSLAKICINPHDLSERPGNVFAFKIIEYLAAGSHVISTPMGQVEEEIAAGITFMPDNTPGTIARTLREVIQTNAWRNTAARAVQGIYHPQVLGAALDKLLRDATRLPGV